MRGTCFALIACSLRTCTCVRRRLLPCPCTRAALLSLWPSLQLLPVQASMSMVQERLQAQSRALDEAQASFAEVEELKMKVGSSLAPKAVVSSQGTAPPGAAA